MTATMWSITWSERDRTDENVRKWFSGDLEDGKIYQVPFPHAITVKMNKTKDKFPVVQAKDTCKVPKWLASCIGLKEKIQVQTHHVDLGYAFTDYKLQGLTVERLIIMLNKQRAPHDLTTLYV